MLRSGAPPGDIAGSSAGTSTVIGTLVGIGLLLGSALGVGTGAATLGGVGALVGNSAGTGAVSGVLDSVTVGKVFRMVPNIDDSPNTFNPALPHFSRIDEDISAPVLSDFVRALTFGKLDKWGFTSAPTGLTECQSITFLIHHQMSGGGGAQGMIFSMKVYAGGVQIAVSSIPIENDDGPLTDTFTFSPLALSKQDIETLQIEINSTSFDPGDWLGASRWTIYTVNADIFYLETEKVIVSAFSTEKVLLV